MFTGLIKEIAEVKRFDNRYLRLKAKYKPSIGDSIAVNGACLTVTKVFNDGFEVELGDETREIVAIENYKKMVHIEPAMRLNDKIEGHIIQGHIDAVGTVEKIVKNINSFDFYIKIPVKYIKFIIPKGSIAIDGVSLTVNEIFNESFRVTIIPITMQKTLFNSYKINRRVNIETDMFARYLYYLFKKEKSISWRDIEKIEALF